MEKTVKIEQIDEQKRQTGATRTEIPRRVVDFYISETQSNSTKKILISLPTTDMRKAR